MPKPDRTTEELLKQLNTAISLLKQASTVLDALQAGWVVPDGPEQPPFIDGLSAIKVHATHSIEVADRLLATMRTL